MSDRQQAEATEGARAALTADGWQRHEDRLRRFAGALEGAGLAAAIVAHPRDLFYLCGTAQPCNLLVVPGRAPTIFARRFGDVVRAEAAVHDIVDAAGLTPILDRLNGYGIVRGCLALPLDVIPAALHLKVARTFPAFDTTSYSPMLLSQRAIKDEHEISEMRSAARLFEAADDAVRASARPGVAEHEVAAEIARAVRRAGHAGLVFYRRWDAVLHADGLLVSGDNLSSMSGHAITITGVGMTPALPFGASRRRLEMGDVLVLDIGLNERGYQADMARTYVLGEPDQLILRRMEAVNATLEACCDAARPGTSGAAVYECAIAVCRHHGVEEWFQGFGGQRGTYVGHGVGLELDEPPLLAASSRELLAEGMTLAIEPKLISPEFGGVDIEDTVVVTAQGAQPLADTSRELRVLDV